MPLPPRPPQNIGKDYPLDVVMQLYCDNFIGEAPNATQQLLNDLVGFTTKNDIGELYTLLPIAKAAIVAQFPQIELISQAYTAWLPNRQNMSKDLAKIMQANWIHDQLKSLELSTIPLAPIPVKNQEALKELIDKHRSDQLHKLFNLDNDD